MAKKKPSDDDRIHGRSREVKHVVKQMSDVDFFDYRLVVKSSGIQELNLGHTGLRQGLVHVENLCEELRSGNYGMAHSDLLRSLQIFEISHNQIRHALVELGEYYDDHPTEVREINHGLTEMCDGCDCLVKALVSLRQTKTGESLEMGRRALTHLREAAHRIGSHLRDIKDCCPSNVEFEVMDIRENEARNNGGIEGAKPVEMTSCHASHAPGEPCNHDSGAPIIPALEKASPPPVAASGKTEIEQPAPSAEKKDVSNSAAAEAAHQEAVAKLAEQLEDKHVPLDKIAAAVESLADPAAVSELPMMARKFSDEAAIEELMRQVSENRSRIIDRLVADARAAKAEVLSDSDYVPLPGEAVPGMRPMNSKRSVSAKALSTEAPPTDTKADEAASAHSEKETSTGIASKTSKSAKGSKKSIENALEKAKEKKEKRPPLKEGAHSHTAQPVEKKKKKEELFDELNFDDAELDFNKASKKKSS